MKNNDSIHTNRLINTTSPYLLQHAHNPVDWFPWGEEAFEKAKAEDKPVLISIGYSACHWCHVMEHESFEDEEVAKVMNEHFICIKVDREERPDVDKVYMDAVQLMGKQGGWPLNCIALPNGKTFFGGTYFPKAQWVDMLLQIDSAYHNRKDDIVEYANRVAEGLSQANQLIKNSNKMEFSPSLLEECVSTWQQNFDNNYGGDDRTMKFPLPNNYQFLIGEYAQDHNSSILKHIELTLKNMAYGGIYDQIGGGMARYATDKFWKVPHFEKMLYDNAQLVSLYSQAFQLTKNPLYKQLVEETLLFIQREMTAKDGMFYSSYDADSDGEEGKFYVWNKEELQKLLGNRYAIAEKYFELNKKGEWEGNYILLREKSVEEVAKELDMTTEDLHRSITEIKGILYDARKTRVWPACDNKTLTSWNALMITGLTDAYQVLGKKDYLEAAIKDANFIWEKQRKKDGSLFHSYKDGRSSVNAHLDDYSFTAEAFIGLYEATFDDSWLQKAKQLTDYAIAHFFDNESGMFYYTSDMDDPLPVRNTEIQDNVIPASNSSMAKALFLLGKYFENHDYSSKSKQLLHNVAAQIPKYGSGYSNWAILYQWNVYTFYEIAFTGPEMQQFRTKMNENYVPFKLYLGTNNESVLPLLEYKYVKNESTIYICIQGACKQPVNTVAEALKQLKE